MSLVVRSVALVRRQVEGEFGSLQELASMANVSRSTVSRFLGDRPTSLASTLQIIAKLRLTFDDVFTPCQEGGGGADGDGGQAAG